MPTPASAALARAMLEEARGYVALGWCQGSSAADAAGRPVPPWSPRAVRWSAVGALVAVWSKYRHAAEDLDDAAVGFLLANTALLGAMEQNPRDWNDARGRTHAEVLAAFEQARASLDHSRPR